MKKYLIKKDSELAPSTNDEVDRAHCSCDIFTFFKLSRATLVSFHLKLIVQFLRLRHKLSLSVCLQHSQTQLDVTGCGRSPGGGERSGKKE